MIILPWFAKELNPNTRCHWSVKAKAVKSARHIAWWVTKESGIKVYGDGKIDICVVFMPPDNRRRDLDNMIASCKGIFDGVADGLGVNDSRFNLSFSVGEVKKGGKVLITLA